MKVLLVEDEKKVSDFIQRGLEKEYINVDKAFDGVVGLQKAMDPSIDVVILDLMLPRMDGLSVLKEIREKNIDTPVLILTAKSNIEDRIAGLDLGADDYLVKPFALGELLARTRALLRRSNQQSNPVMEISDLKVNYLNHEVSRAGKKIDLTAKEYALLEFFINNLGRAINRMTIAEHVWHYNFDSGTNYIDVYVNRLRKKLGDTGQDRLIKTIRGYGYIFKP